MHRRSFISLVGGAAAWPLASAAQQVEGLRRIGVLIPWPENDPLAKASVAAFERALANFGWVAGRNIQLSYCYAAADPARFKACATQLVSLKPDAILASSAPALAALRDQSHTIPLVFVLVPDPVGMGFVQSLAQPGGNITGFTLYDPSLMGKWLEMLKETAPGTRHVAVIFNPDTTPYAPLFNRAIKEAAPSFELTVTLAPVHSDSEVEGAVAAVAGEPGGGIINLPESWSVSHRTAIIAATARHGLPLMGGTELFPRAGGLISYWFDAVDVHAQAARYIDSILKGAKPADLPIQDPTRLMLIINLKTAKALGLTVPQVLLATADEIIE